MVDSTGTFYWNPGAISYLVEVLLALILSAYFVRRLMQEHRQGGMFAPTLLFGVTFWFLVPGLFVTLLHALVGGGWSGYAMPWLAPTSPYVLAMPWVTTFTGIAAIAFVQFAYRFPARLPESERESVGVGVAMALCVVVEIASAVLTNQALVEGRVWFRPEWLAGWRNIAMVWALVLFARQLVWAQSGVPRKAGFAGMLRSMIVDAPANREVTAARGFILFSLLPAAHTTALVLQSDGLLGDMSMDFLIGWSVLAQLTGLTLVYFGYLPERSSFLFKLTAVSLVLLFAVINGACWVINPAYTAQFRAPGMVKAGTTLQFAPDANGGYAQRTVPFAPAPQRGSLVGTSGAKLALPFAFTFYGKRYDTVHIAANGTIGLHDVLAPGDVAIGYGKAPAIYPLLVAVPAGGAVVTADVAPDRLTVTRKDRCAAPHRQGCYAFQTAIHADGRITMTYLAMPDGPMFEQFDPLTAPWLMGITPGATASGQPPMIRDYYRAYLAYLDRLFAPIVPFIIGMMVAILAGIPLLFRGFLVRPLDRLLRAMRRFRDGDLPMRVPVTFNDEIGYLTESFNQMAHAQHELVNTLEDRVARRSAQVADFAARNARLEERNRLSSDLHDTVTQTLFSAAMLSDGLADQWRRDPDAGEAMLTQLAQLNRHALAEMRLMLTELRASGITEHPLAQLIAELALEFQTGQVGTVSMDIQGEAVLPLDVQAMFYRIAQESFNNIFRHAAADRVDIAFEGLPGQAILSIRDDGRGFDPAAVAPGHLGLEIMRERAKRIGATLEIESAPGAGTSVNLIWMQQG